MTTIRRTALAVALIGASFGAQAATTVTWDFTTGDTSNPYANSWNYTTSGKTVTLRAFYADSIANVNSNGTGDSTINTTLRNNTQAATIKAQSTTNSQFAGLGSFGGSGIGISNPFDTPATNNQETSYGGQHAVDNYDVTSTGTYNPSGGTHAHDFLLFDFNEVLAPTDFRIGYKQFANTDIDFFIAPTTVASGFTLQGQTVNSLLAAGWTKATFNNVQDCAPTEAGSPCPTSFATGSYSNSGGALSGMPANLKTRYMVAAGALGGNDDAFKFAQITMNVPGGGTVPVPAPLALLAIGGIALAASRRRRA